MTRKMKCVLLFAAFGVTAPAYATPPAALNHYAPNGNWGGANGNTFLPGTDGFNFADVPSAAYMPYLPPGVKALVYLGYSSGNDATFRALVGAYDTYQTSVAGFYVVDDPTTCDDTTSDNLKAETTYIYSHYAALNHPGVLTYMTLENTAASPLAPVFCAKFSPALTGIEYYGINGYPVRSDSYGYNLAIVDAYINEGVNIGIAKNQMVPEYQVFGGGGYSTWVFPTLVQERAIQNRWAADGVTTPLFDEAYSWGVQLSDNALSTANSAMHTYFQCRNSGGTGC